jgi:hypothetical protein
MNPRAYGSRTFEEDINFIESKEEAISLIMKADLIHCHHWIDLQYNPFGIDFRGKAVVRHFHSEPDFVAYHANVERATIIFEDIPQIVVAQHQERYYPFARPVPNIINTDQIQKVVASLNVEKDDLLRIGFHPTSESDCFSERWNTKGSVQTLQMLERLKNGSIVIENQKNVPHSVLLSIRARCDILLDEMVTGAYHLTGLESLALGKPTFGYIDQRCAYNIFAITDCSTLPWLNFSLNELEKPLLEFCTNKQLREYVGIKSKEWINQHWSDKALVLHYVDVYDEVLRGRRMLRNGLVDDIFDIAIHDNRWENNMKNLINILYR